MSDPNPPEVYRYPGADGQPAFADRLEAIPEELRDLATKIELPKGAEVSEAVKDVAERARGLVERRPVREVGDVLPFVQELDAPSVAVGFGAGMLVFFVLSLVRRTFGIAFRLALLALVVTCVGGGYLGWLRRSAGLGDERLSSPNAVIQDAQKAVKGLEDSLRSRQRQLDELEENQ